jgi:methyltransferase (TIGR00027 family)
MREGSPSVTARRVAGYRLGFGRLAAPFGDPAADERLARDVAGRTVPADGERMARYLRARTAFFDRVVLNALGRDVSQVVNAGAGYDGRALRYAKPGVRWFEADHPDTQRDKRQRLDRLGIGTPHVTFLARDLRDAGLAAALTGAGYEPDAPSLVICEGVAVYLDEAVLEALLGELRAVAAIGTRLAVSFRISAASAQQRARREQLDATVAALGEPALSSVSADGASRLLAATRWRAADLSERSRRAGFVVAAPEWVPAATAQPPTGGQPPSSPAIPVAVNRPPRASARRGPTAPSPRSRAWTRRA